MKLSQIDKEAKAIKQKVKTGELIEGCCMSSIHTPTVEAWCIAEELTENATLSDVQQQKLFSKLDNNIQMQLETTGYDDFDLVYERLLQLIEPQP